MTTYTITIRQYDEYDNLTDWHYESTITRTCTAAEAVEIARGYCKDSLIYRRNAGSPTYPCAYKVCDSNGNKIACAKLSLKASN